MNIQKPGIAPPQFKSGPNFLRMLCVVKVMSKIWYKGNTHAHTLNSDGDSSSGEVAHWFRDHGYDFVVISEAIEVTPKK